MVIADMDGTFLRSDLNVSEQNIHAIKQLQEKGIIVSFATGRPAQLMKEYVDKLHIENPIIMNNGAVIGNPFSNTMIYEQTLDKNVVYDTISYCEQERLQYMIYTKDAIFANPNPRTAFFEKRNERLPKHQQSRLELLGDDPWKVVDQYDINKVLIVEYNPVKFHHAQLHFNAQPNCTVVSSQEGFIDINPVGTSKGNALKILARYHNISTKDIVAFGDQDNDIEMLQIAGIGVAMGNANAAIKQIADCVTLSNDNDGFAVWIEKHIFDTEN